MQKHLRSKNHSENNRQNEIIVAECLFKVEQSPIKKQIKNIYNPKSLKQLARQNK